MPPAVILCIRRIHLQSDNLKVFPCYPARLSNVSHIRHLRTLPCQDQDFLQAGSADLFHLPFNPSHIQSGTADLIVTVKPTVDTIILTIIGYIQWGKHDNRIAEMPSRLLLRHLCHLFQNRQRRRRKKSSKIIQRPVFALNGTHDVLLRIPVVIIGIHCFQHLFCNIRIQHLHILHIGHMIDAFLFHILPD